MLGFAFSLGVAALSKIAKNLTECFMPKHIILLTPWPAGRVQLRVLAVLAEAVVGPHRRLVLLPKVWPKKNLARAGPGNGTHSTRDRCYDFLNIFAKKFC
jgi:hypothetical protein